jgi:hypothetical protein
MRPELQAFVEAMNEILSDPALWADVWRGFAYDCNDGLGWTPEELCL